MKRQETLRNLAEVYRPKSDECPSCDWRAEAMNLGTGLMFSSHAHRFVETATLEQQGNRLPSARSNAALLRAKFLHVQSREKMS